MFMSPKMSDLDYTHLYLYKVLTREVETRL